MDIETLIPTLTPIDIQSVNMFEPTGIVVLKSGHAFLVDLELGTVKDMSLPGYELEADDAFTLIDVAIEYLRTKEEQIASERHKFTRALKCVGK